MFTEIGRTEECAERAMYCEKSESVFSVTESEVRIRIVALGIGGMGQNAMENLALEDVDGLEIYAVNTDMQALSKCKGSHAVQIGKKRTCGRGAGGDSEIGRLSAEDDIETLKAIVSGAELVFLAAGMGGGTGTGAAPVLGRICREMGIMTIGVVTSPMNYEGPRRMEKARTGLAAMRRTVDSLMVIENEKLSMVMNDGDISIINAFKKADRVLVDGLKSVARMINLHGYINLDLADLINVIKRPSGEECGDILIGVGEARGEDRACHAATKALNNPLLANSDIFGSVNLLINVAGSEDMGLQEALSAVKIIEEKAGNVDREIFMGVVADNSLGDTMCVTVIANGLGLVKKISEDSVPAKQKIFAQDAIGYIRASEKSAMCKTEKENPHCESDSNDEAKFVSGDMVVRARPEVHSRSMVSHLNTVGTLEADRNIGHVGRLNNSEEELDQSRIAAEYNKYNGWDETTLSMKTSNFEGNDNDGRSPVINKEIWKTPAGLRRQLSFQELPETKIVNLGKREKNGWRSRVLNEENCRQISMLDQGCQAVCS